MTGRCGGDDPLASADAGGALNRESYDRIAPRWDEARVGAGMRERERELLEMLLAELPAPAEVLDVGCGTGRPIAELVLARGHRVTGVDQSAEQLRIAQARFPRDRFPQARWVLARIEDRPFDGEYDAAICWDALFHVAREHHRAVLESLHAHLVPGGLLVLTVGGSAHPAFTDTMFGERFFYDSFPPDEVLAMMREIGFGIVADEFLDRPQPERDKGRYVIAARARANLY